MPGGVFAGHELVEGEQLGERDLVLDEGEPQPDAVAGTLPEPQERHGVPARLGLLHEHFTLRLIDERLLATMVLPLRTSPGQTSADPGNTWGRGGWCMWGCGSPRPCRWSAAALAPLCGIP